MIYTTDKNGNKVIDVLYYESIGLYLSDDGALKGMNENIFARYLLTKFDLAVRHENQFYQYKDNYWQKLSQRKLKRLLYNHFNHLVDNAWTAGLEICYLSALINVCNDSDELIQGDDYINLKNGLYYLGDKWEFQPHNKEVFTPSQIPITYDENNPPECPDFIAFLNDIFNSDAELINLVQEIIGYTLCNTNKAHKFFIFYGHGRNGKSVLCDIISALVGEDNVTHIPLKSFNVSFELADIVDKKLNIATENDNVSLKTEKLKIISAGEPIQINAKFEKPFSYLPCTKLIFAVNKLPTTIDTSDGFMERLSIIPFNNKYVYEPIHAWERMRDPFVEERLKKELDGIFVFALNGLKRLIANKYRFTHSKAADDLLKQYIATINPYIDFINTKIVIAKNDKSTVKKTAVYTYFKEWANSQGYHHFTKISARAFYFDFEITLQSLNLPCALGKSNGTRNYKGIRLI